MSATPRSGTLSTAAASSRLLGGKVSRWIGTILLVVAIVIFFSVANDDWFSIANYTLIAAIAAISLNVLSGYTGQISLGIAFFMAIGAYTSAWLGGNIPTSSFDPLGLGLPFIIWLPAAGVVAALAGALIGPTALRLKGFYLGIVSLALIFIGQYLFFNVRSITGGPQGRTFPVPAIGDAVFSQQNSYFGLALTSGQQYFLLILIVLVLVAFFVYNVARTRAGRAFQAVRDNEIGASIMGVNLFEAKMGSFILSSFIAGIAGALFASYSQYIIPDYWSLALSIQFIAAIIIGGVASVWGSILGAAFVFGLPLVIDHFNLLPVASGSGMISGGDLNALLYGLLIIIFLLFEPGGVIGLVRRIQALNRRFNAGKDEGGEPAEITDLPASVESQVDSGGSTITKGESA
ncbi:MAG TPA: branched-chain amino acid ABC transporter permease [Ktedonobacteraceae bacterium]|jgi:branched-chain amino acid transport system permease protein|nr:branched-chain amino acid ABC transporter permease [Ktedonobacteraceae bacterium]